MQKADSFFGPGADFALAQSSSQADLGNPLDPFHPGVLPRSSGRRRSGAGVSDDFSDGRASAPMRGPGIGRAADLTPVETLDDFHTGIGSPMRHRDNGKRRSGAELPDRFQAQLDALMSHLPVASDLRSLLGDPGVQSSGLSAQGFKSAQRSGPSLRRPASPVRNNW